MLVKHLFIIVQCPKSPSVHSQKQKKKKETQLHLFTKNLSPSYLLSLTKNETNENQSCYLVRK